MMKIQNQNRNREMLFIVVSIGAYSLHTTTNHENNWPESQTAYHSSQHSNPIISEYLFLHQHAAHIQVIQNDPRDLGVVGSDLSLCFVALRLVPGEQIRPEIDHTHFHVYSGINNRCNAIISCMLCSM
jgi:hypothetical protein